MLNNNFCPSCFEQFADDSGICKKCGFNINTYHQKESALPLYTKLNERYIVGKVLGQGGFGITYKAYDTFQNQIVAIKEYMPSDYSERKGKTVHPLTGDGKAERIFEHGKSSYIAEIKTLFRFSNVDGIVKIYANFQENNTAYLVMEYLQGCSLRSYAKMHGGNLLPAKAGKIIYDVAAALTKVHESNILHRDISPENIFLVNNGNTVKLIDFGAARHYIENSEEERSVLLKPGFAPPEQYSRTGNQGPWTDVYALAATMYYIVSGQNAPDSISRMQNDTLKPLNTVVPSISSAMANVVSKAMELDCKLRTQNCTEFMNGLAASGWLYVKDTRPDSYFHPPVNPPTDPSVIPPGAYPIPQQTKHGIVCKVDCVFGDKKGNFIEFKPGQQIVVGRNLNGVKYCDLEVSLQNYISKRHCMVEFDLKSKQFVITDLSANGTFTQKGRRLKKYVKEYFPIGSILCLATENVIIQFNAFYR